MKNKTSAYEGRIRCSVCKTSISRAMIERIVGERLLRKVSEMEQRDEDIYNSDEYQTLKLVAESLLSKKVTK